MAEEKEKERPYRLEIKVDKKLIPCNPFETESQMKKHAKKYRHLKGVKVKGFLRDVRIL